jgi:uncharacterized protein (TIGR03118 family)
MKVTRITTQVALVSALGVLASLTSTFGQVFLVDPRTAVTATMDGGTAKTGNTWYELGAYAAEPTTGLKTGLVTSQTDTNSTYQIQPAVGMNSFMLDATFLTGTITLETPVALHGFSLAGSDGNGSAPLVPTLHFTDGSSDTLAPVIFGDWFGNTPIVYTTDGRINVDPPNADDQTPTSGNPRVLAANVTNSVADAAKTISSISFAWKGSGDARTCIFGLSGDSTGTGHYSPIALTPDSYNQDMIVGVAEVSHNAYVQQNLVSDLNGVAPVTDTNLVNPWGIVTSASSPFWVSDERTGLSTLYNSTGGVQSLVVTVPPPAGSTAPSTPTGVIFNGTTNFVIPVSTSNAPAHFIFATLDGTISAWASSVQPEAVLEVDNSAVKAVYTGLAMASVGASPATNLLYAANFRAGTIDVFDSNFKPVTNSPPLTTKAVPFADTKVPAGFAPFNVQTIGANLYVTYAEQSTNTPMVVPGSGGFVDVFDTSGNLLRRLATHGPLNSPWGLALAPASFGSFGGALLVGNFGDGRVNAFDATLGTPLGPLLDTNGSPIVNAGLWGLIFGNGGNGGGTNTLYFTAGSPGTNGVQSHGLLGSISFEANQTPGVPWELLQTVNGYQDNFDTAILNSNWVALANDSSTPNQYQQVGSVGQGVLRVFSSIGDPNHLLYMAPGYSNSVQEVLARIRVVGFQKNQDGPRGGIAVAVTTNPNPGPSRGINLHFRDSSADLNDNNQSERKFKLLYDGVAWGPQGLEVNGVEVGWTNNVWYWMRLRQDAGASGANDVFAKVWPSDGLTPEPAEWQMVWGYLPANPPLSTGFAGIAGSSGSDNNGALAAPVADGFGQTEVNYILIKAAGLPSITAGFGVFGPPSNPPVITGITRTNNTVTVDWFGGQYLESATSLLGPWSIVPIPDSAPYSPLTVPIATGPKFYRIQR